MAHEANGEVSLSPVTPIYSSDLGFFLINNIMVILLSIIFTELKLFPRNRKVKLFCVPFKKSHHTNSLALL